MYRLYGIPTQNTLKAAYVLDALGLDYEYKQLDLAKAEHKTAEFLKINPVGKVPALKHNDFCVFESNTICRYIASQEKSDLYDQDIFKKTTTDQWLDFLSNHLGRWLSTLYFEKVLKQLMKRGEPSTEKCEEALGFVNQQILPVEGLLSESPYFGGDKPSIADYAAYAYLDQTGAIKYDLTPYKHTKAWLASMDKLASVKLTKSKLKFQ